MTKDAPKYNFKVKKNEDEKKQIFCPVRKKYVTLLPEELVRQQFSKYLVEEKGYPIGLFAFEYPLKYNNQKKRGDIVVFDTKGCPILIVECKAPQIKITQKAFDQAARYNRALKLNYLIVTNGETNYCCFINHEKGEFKYLKEIPNYKDIS